MVESEQTFDEITGLSPTVAVEQRVIRQSNPRSTVGTRTKIGLILSALFVAYGKLDPDYDNGRPLEASMFQRNSPRGMCVKCLGRRIIPYVDEKKLMPDFSVKLKDIFKGQEDNRGYGNADTQGLIDWVVNYYSWSVGKSNWISKLTCVENISCTRGIHYHCPMLDQMLRSNDWVGHIADIAVKDMPGTKYIYKEWDIILLSEVLNNVSGDLYEFTNENLYKPLGIKSEGWFKSASGTYYTIGKNEENEKQSNLTAMDMHKIGKLFLDNGVYEDKQIISKAYIDMATAPSSAKDDYGFMWWRGLVWL